MYLRFAFRDGIFFKLSVMLAGPHPVMAYFLIIMNDSVSCQFQRIRSFRKIISHRGTMTLANDVQWVEGLFSVIIILIIGMMTIMIV